MVTGRGTGAPQAAFAPVRAQSPSADGYQQGGLRRADPDRDSCCATSERRRDWPRPHDSDRPSSLSALAPARTGLPHYRARGRPLSRIDPLNRTTTPPESVAQNSASPAAMSNRWLTVTEREVRCRTRARRWKRSPTASCPCVRYAYEHDGLRVER